MSMGSQTIAPARIGQPGVDVRESFRPAGGTGKARSSSSASAPTRSQASTTCRPPHLEGNFPGGTVDLTFRFGLRDDRIATLQIVPTETAES